MSLEMCPDFAANNLSNKRTGHAEVLAKNGVAALASRIGSPDLIDHGVCQFGLAVSFANSGANISFGMLPPAASVATGQSFWVKPSEMGVARYLAVAPSFDHVCNIVGLSSQFQVFWITAGRIVASVTHNRCPQKIARWDRPVGHFPGEAMRKKSACTHPHQAISIHALHCQPKPAGRRLRDCHLGPETLSGGHDSLLSGEHHSGRSPKWL